VQDDDGGLSGVMTTMVQVNNVPPTISVSGSTTVDEGKTLTLNISASDVGVLDVVTLAATGLPAGASFSQTAGNPATGILSWTPAYTQAGSYDGISITATDDDGGTTNQSLTLTVNEAGQPVIAVTNSNDRSVSLIDAQTNEVAGTETVGKRPVAASFFDILFDGSASPAELYVAERDTEKESGADDDESDSPDKGNGGVQVLVGPSSPTPANAFDFSLGTAIPVGNRPQGLAIKPDGTQVWVPNRNDDTISVIDRASDSLVATIPLKVKEIKGKKEYWKEIGRRPVAVGFSHDGKFAYVVGRNSNNLIVIDTGSKAVLASVEVGNKPVALAVSLDGAKVYVANRNGSNVAVVDVSTPAAPILLAQIPVGEEPEGIVLLNGGTKLYVTSKETNSVWVFEALSGPPYLSLLKTVAVGQGPSGIGVTRSGSFVNGDFVYIANRDDNTVSVIDALTDGVVTTLPVGKGPQGVAAGIVPTGP
jgi:YVTN family beta-propeller protein